MPQVNTFLTISMSVICDFSLLATLSDPSFDPTVLDDLDDDLEGQLMVADPQLPLGVTSSL